jgi:septal ring factor EnvC (AmiA/AmiB activator)
MKPIAKTLLIAALILGGTLPAYADHHEGLWERMHRIDQRIEQGVRSGELTRREVHRLDRERHEIRAMFREFRDDHHLSHKERRILEYKIDRLSEHVAALKHNDRERHDRDHYYRDRR